jgi:hypothetical protein
VYVSGGIKKYKTFNTHLSLLIDTTFQFATKTPLAHTQCWRFGFFYFLGIYVDRNFILSICSSVVKLGGDISDSISLILTKNFSNGGK